MSKSRAQKSVIQVKKSHTQNSVITSGKIIKILMIVTNRNEISNKFRRERSLYNKGGGEGLGEVGERQLGRKRGWGGGDRLK